MRFNSPVRPRNATVTPWISVGLEWNDWNSDFFVSNYHKRSLDSPSFPLQFTNFLFQFTNYCTTATMTKVSTALALFLALYVTTAQHIGPGATGCADAPPTPTLTALSPLPGHVGFAALPEFTEGSAADWMFANDSLIFLVNVLFAFFFVTSIAEATSTLGVFLLSVPFKVVYILIRFIFASFKNVSSIFSSRACLLTEYRPVCPPHQIIPSFHALHLSFSHYRWSYSYF